VPCDAGPETGAKRTPLSNSVFLWRTVSFRYHAEKVALGKGCFDGLAEFFRIIIERYAIFAADLFGPSVHLRFSSLLPNGSAKSSKGVCILIFFAQPYESKRASKSRHANGS
jgi:hypothetical protein